MPDYAFANSDSPAGTSTAGLVGSVIVALTAVAVCLLGGFFRKRKRAANAKNP